MKNKRKPLSMVLAAIGAITVIGWYVTVSGTVEQDETAKNTESPARPVPTALVKDAVHDQTLMFPGTVQAQSRVEIGFSLDGLLVELNGREGKKIAKGDILARIDPRDFQHEYDAAKANYERAKTELARAQTLLGKKVISQAEFDIAQTTYNVARAELKIRKKALEDTVIIAPYDGVIDKRYVENHENVKKQTPVLAYKDISQIEVVIQVPETQIAHGGAESFRDIMVNFDADRERWFSGKVEEFRVQSNPVTRTYEVTISLHPPTHMQVLPGMTATVRLAGSAAQNSYERGQNIQLVPVEAVFGSSDGNSYAWVIPEEAGAPQKVQLTLGALRDGDIEIIDSLRSGQRVAVSGVHSLREDIQVRAARHGKEGLDG